LQYFCPSGFAHNHPTLAFGHLANGLCAPLLHCFSFEFATHFGVQASAWIWVQLRIG
jgi:hypothetical protein